MNDKDIIALPDLASRSLGGAVLWANNEDFAEKENLILPADAGFNPATFGHKGQIYDGWETRRRRGQDGKAPSPEDCDTAIIRLGVSGIIKGVVVDTAWFKGNFPPEISVEATIIPGYPDISTLHDAMWVPIVERSAVEGDTKNLFHVQHLGRFTHVRLKIYPDGGVARLRVYGLATPDPKFLDGRIDLAAIENGGYVWDCSNLFYSHPQNIIMPGRARNMGDGWETSRRRDGNNDWVQIQLADQSLPTIVEIDTTYFLFNSPGAVSLTGITTSGEEVELLDRTNIQPDTRHIFELNPNSKPITQIRLNAYPDGGLSRLKILGTLTPEGLKNISDRFNQ